MRDDFAMSESDAAVYKRIPTEWADEMITGADIALALERSSGDVMRRISRFVSLGFVQRKHGRRGRFSSDIRRVKKED
jgi:predicted transcriptional regulator